jgi:hypothetical protein
MFIINTQNTVENEKMANITKAQNAALKAKMLYISRGVKGYFLTVNDYIELINSLNENEDDNATT